MNRTNDYRGWEITIVEQRSQLRHLLKQSPSLKNYSVEVFDEVYQDALAKVKVESGAQLPDEWEFDRSVDTLLSATFWQDLH